MPMADLPETYRATAASGEAAWPAAGWWKGFGSAELDTLIADARAANLDIAAAAARVRQADAQLALSGAALLPSVSASADASWNRATARKIGGITGKNIETRSYQLGPAVSWELDLWGRIAASRDAALASALASLTYYTGHKLMAMTEDNTEQALRTMLGEQTRTVWRLLDGVEVEAPFAELKLGDVLVVSAGDIIPVDGTVVQGLASIDQRLLSGEARPVEKALGDPVYAGTALLAGR
ncbi:MAG: TolC family protein, partial [Alphaproteobacteria bacterium]|nr:TolC family protein [Alphaproteobacteria bacterium]